MTNAEKRQLIMDELAALRLEMALEQEIARERERLMLTLAEKYGYKTTACDYLRSEDVDMFSKENRYGPA